MRTLRISNWALGAGDSLLTPKRDEGSKAQKVWVMTRLLPSDLHFPIQANDTFHLRKSL